MENNFNLTFGKKPSYFITRIKETEEIKNSFLSKNPTNQVYIITGVRGSGKTTLLTDINKSFSKLDNWVVVDLNSSDDLMKNLISELCELGITKRLFLKKEINFSLKGLSLSLTNDKLEATPMVVLKRILSKFKEKNMRILITIDEIENNQLVKIFLKNFQSLIRFDYPIFLIMTGLYQNISNVQNDKTLTFLYRAPRIYLSNLSLISVESSYNKIFKFSYDKSLKLAKATKGYAFAYQLLGYLLIQKKKNDIDDELLDEYLQCLSDFVYEKVWGELSNSERKILKVWKEDKPLDTKTIVKLSKISPKTFSVLRDRLIKKGVLESKSFGTLELNLPMFHLFIRAQ